MTRQLRYLLGLCVILSLLPACGSFNVSFGNESQPEAAVAATAVGATTAVAPATVPTAVQSTAFPPPAQPSPEYVIVERLRFTSGTTRLAVEGTASQELSPRYVLGAQTGQIAQITLTSTNDAANYAITGPNGRLIKRLESEARSIEFEIPTTGDYIISIGAADDDITYVLTVEIPTIASQSATGPSAESPPAESTAERIRFEVGATSATVEGTVNESASTRYVFWALADQTANIRLASTNDAARYSVTDPGGQIIKQMESETRSRGFEISARGDYTIDISAPADSVQYTLTLEIE